MYVHTYASIYLTAAKVENGRAWGLGGTWVFPLAAPGSHSSTGRIKHSLLQLSPSGSILLSLHSPVLSCLECP